MSNTLDLIEEKPLISIQELSQKLSVSIRTIRRWNSEAQKMGGFTKNEPYRVCRRLFYLS